jgi:hypothetical protein
MNEILKANLSFYEAYRGGMFQPNLPELRIQYKDYAEQAQFHLGKWKSTKIIGCENFAGALPVLDSAKY